MGLFNSKELGEKLGAAKKKMGEVVADAKLDEKFEQAKKSVGESVTEFKEKNAEAKADKNEAKAPIEGSLIRYQVIYLGGFPMKPNKKSDSTALGFNVMEDSFIFKP